ncbi:hypothetical protein MRB53_034598 [Persea americana]|uniref:Uncharacterized protein n=1 Tax=Persea americana TaxID=3435 RepID=A0ACC2K278_PERAE|nr:hypothetical protein MRB53_034598 [Persea americana]
MPTPSSMVGIPGSLTTESTVTPTPTQDLLVEQRTLSTTPTSLPQDMVRASTSKRVRGATRGINTERLIAASGGTKLVVAVPLEELVKKRKKARANLPLNHTMGSQSFAAAMSEHGQRPDITDFYKLTHYSTKKKKWVTPICEQVHVQLEAHHQEDESRRKEDEALGLPVTMPQEEMPMEVLGKKFYVKEYGVGLKRPSSKQSSAKSHDEETIRAYDEKFAHFDAVMSAYMQGGLVGEGSNSRETFEDVVVYKATSTYDNLLMALGPSSKSMADVYQRRWVTIEMELLFGS